MKTILLAAIILLYSGTADAQLFMLNISYGKVEKSKDSHTMMETFMINGTSVNYTVRYSGRRGPNETNASKTCLFTQEQVKEIIDLVKVKNLDKDDSLTILSDQKSFQTISLNLYMMINNKSSDISIIGEPNGLKDQTLYKNSMVVLALVRKMFKECK